jgi:hypothetical protein
MLIKSPEELGAICFDTIPLSCALSESLFMKASSMSVLISSYLTLFSSIFLSSPCIDLSLFSIACG